MTADKKMHYYASKSAKESLGYIDLVAVLSIFPSEKKGPRRYSISMNTAERQWVLCTDSAGNLEKWLKMLEVCVGVARRFITSYEGYLGKKGKLNKSWRRRYFALGNQWLFYFETKEDCMNFKRIAFFSEKVFQQAFFKHVRGSIPLERATLTRIPSSNVRMDVSTSNRTFHLEADSSDELEDWIDVILLVQEAAIRAREAAQAGNRHDRTPTALLAPQLSIPRVLTRSATDYSQANGGFAQRITATGLSPVVDEDVVEAFESDVEDTPNTSPRQSTVSLNQHNLTIPMASSRSSTMRLARSRSNLEHTTDSDPMANASSRSMSRGSAAGGTRSVSLRRPASRSQTRSKTTLREKMDAIRNSTSIEKDFDEETDDYGIFVTVSDEKSPEPPKTPREAAARAAAHTASMVMNVGELRALTQRMPTSKEAEAVDVDEDDELMPLPSYDDGGESSDSEAPEAALEDVSISPPTSLSRNEILQSTKRVSRIFSRKRKSLLSKSAQSKTFQIDVEHQIEVGTEVLSESYCEDCEDDDDEGDEYSDESDIEEGTLPSRFAGITAERYEQLVTQEEQLATSRQVQEKRCQEHIILENRRRFKTFYNDLSEGYRIVKHTLGKPPEVLLVRIDRSTRAFSWGNFGKKQKTVSMLESDVRIVLGKYSPTLLATKLISDNVCFALVTPKYELEFQVKCHADRDFFVQLLRSLARSKPVSSEENELAV